MAAPLTSLTVNQWDTLKAPFGKTPKLKALFGGGASVGPALKSFIAARAAWEKEKTAKAETYPTAEKYFMATSKLKDAFDKFEKIKDLSTAEAKTMKDSVAQWKREAVTLFQDQGKYILANKPALMKGAKQGLSNTTESMGLGKLTK